MVEKSKALVTRGALERVLARAAELQGSGDDGEPSDALTEAQVEELGREVGLSPEHIRQALAEERARIQPLTISGSGVGYQLFGANKVGAQRVVRGTPARLFPALDRWMQKEEFLHVVRQRPDFITWEPSGSIFGSVRRLLGSRDYALYRSDEITATIVPVDDEFSLVRIEASFARLRRAMAWQTAVGSVVGSGASVVAALLVAPEFIPLAFVPMVGLSAVSYYGSRRTQLHATGRALLSLEHVLDRLERGDMQTPSLLKMIESALPPSR